MQNPTFLYLKKKKKMRKDRWIMFITWGWIYVTHFDTMM